MQSRRDQVQAHMFIMGRITSGMLRSEPDAPESPQGRTNRGTVIGVVLAVLICAGAYVFGMFWPGGSNSWRSHRNLIVDEDTGSRYLYLSGRLRPVRNYASARLIGGSSLKPTTVHTASLSGTPHGPPVGTKEAPDELPSASEVGGGTWMVCGRGANGSGPHTTLAVNSRAHGDGLTKRQALLVAGPDKDEYVVWHGSRFRLDRHGGARTALGYGPRTPLHVSNAFLNALPAGPDLAAPDTPGLGGNGPKLDGQRTRIGQAFKVGALGSAPRYYQLRKEGLAEVTATVADLLMGDKRVREKAYGGGPVAASKLDSYALGGHLASKADRAELAGLTEELPPSPPHLLTPGHGKDACVRNRPSSAGPRVSVAVADGDALGTAAKIPREAAEPCVRVDRIAVPSGGGALVRALSADGSKAGAGAYVVTDTGVKYRVASKTALNALGYSADQLAGVPSPLLSMLPTGPDLSKSGAVGGKAVTTAPPCREKDKAKTS